MYVDASGIDADTAGSSGEKRFEHYAVLIDDLGRFLWQVEIALVEVDFAYLFDAIVPSFTGTPTKVPVMPHCPSRLKAQRSTRLRSSKSASNISTIECRQRWKSSSMKTALFILHRVGEKRRSITQVRSDILKDKL